jgi:hypothetical protein
MSYADMTPAEVALNIAANMEDTLFKCQSLLGRDRDDKYVWDATTEALQLLIVTHMKKEPAPPPAPTLRVV